MLLSKMDLWDNFCSKYRILETGMPLFESSERIVTLLQHGNDKRWMLKRSVEMEQLVNRETQKLIEDYSKNTNRYEGVIYMMYWVENQRIIPLYIGKSEKFGKMGNNLSKNITNKAFFSRWGYSYAYHIGDLSAVVCIGHCEENINFKYKRWAEKLFTSWPSLHPQLKQETYFWMQAWNNGDVGIWQDFGSTSLTFLEYLLIGVADVLFSEHLLNKEGVNRR